MDRAWISDDIIALQLKTFFNVAEKETLTLTEQELIDV